LDFIAQERQRPLITEPASAAAQAHLKLFGPRYDTYYHRGLN